MNLSDLDLFEPEPVPPIKKQPLKLAGLLILLAMSAPLWILVFGVAFPLAYLADMLMSGWRKLTGYREPESSVKFSFHTTMPDGSIAHFQIVKTQRLTESNDQTPNSDLSEE